MVLLLGPLYHLTERSDRVLAMAEARRAVTPGGLVAAGVISRFASLHDGLVTGMILDPAFEAMIARTLPTGEHRPPPDREWFTTAYFHRPEELAAEMGDAGLVVEAMLPVEGAAWLMPGLDRYLDDDTARETLLRSLTRIEREPSLLGVSGHLLGFARAPPA